MYSYIFIISMFAVASISGERLYEQIYSPIEGTSSCFRRLNATHQAGCSSKNGGAVGIVELVNDIESAQWIVFNSSGGAYMAVVSTTVFQDVIEIFIQHPENVAGVLLFKNVNKTPSYFSPDSRCPNEYTSAPESQCKSSIPGGKTWNVHGTGLLHRDIPFPIFYLSKIDSKEILKIKSCYERYNLDKDNHKGQSLCSLQLNSFMYAAVSSTVCMRRSPSSHALNPVKMCDPLSGYNVYYSLFRQTKNNSVILVTARIDSASLFDGLAPGAASSVVGMVSLITAATTLAKMIPSSEAQKYKKNVIWNLLNGETFDYIGSQRIAFDLKRNSWPPQSPLSLSDISLHVELGQLGGSLKAFSGDSSWPLYAIAHDASSDSPKIKEFIGMLNKYFAKNMTLATEFTKNLPPSSLHSFRREFKNDTFPEFILADYKDTFTNMLYNSVLDDIDNIGFDYRNITIDNNGTFLDTDALIADGTMKENDLQVKIARLATSIAQTLYEQVTDTPYNANITASAHLVDEMLYCFLNNQSCRLLLAAGFASEGGLPHKPVSMYVGVSLSSGMAATFAGHALMLLTGDDEKVNDRVACNALNDTGYNFYWLRGWNNSGICLRTTLNFTQAISPALKEFNGLYTYESQYSTWTESVWDAIWARVFVSAGGGGARVAACTGFLATALGAALTYWLQKHSNLIFVAIPSSDITSDATTGILRTVNC